MKSAANSQVNRRTFLKSASAASAGLLLVKPETAFGAQANSQLRLGLFGCGGRGPWIANFFQEHTNTKVVAVQDYFLDRVTRAGERFEIEEKHRYIGLDGYKELLANAEVDAVAVISPAYFHPEQAVAALEAGKHLYLAKPIAVDVPGCMAIVDAAEKHGKQLSSLVDFQTRKSPPFMEAAQAVHEGKIGELVSGQSLYHAGRLGIQTKPGTDVARLRNWAFDIPLSGDIIVEQNIHTLDVANWLLQAHPVKAYGTGGRKARVDVGDCWDHFNVIFTYPGEKIIGFGSTQYAKSYNTISALIFGKEGTVDVNYGGSVTVKNGEGTIVSGETPDIYAEGAIQNIKDFHASIMAGAYLNNTVESAHSTMTSILGRMAAYRNRVVTWDEMLAENERLDPKLDLPADGPMTPVERG